MCTAATFKTKKGNVFFGRNLDYEMSYGEKIVSVSRSYPFVFRHTENCLYHYAIIGMAHVEDNYPLFYDALNEKGLAVAGLNFVSNAYYFDIDGNKDNVASFELISYILAKFKNVYEVKKALENINIVNTAYSDKLPPSSLHWIVVDKKGDCIVIESMKDGLHVYDNKTGCLTNNPPFNYQLDNLKKYSFLSDEDKVKTFSFDDSFYSRGTGSTGLPGDLTSTSRFIRVCYASYFSQKENDFKLINDENEKEFGCNSLYYILQSVEQVKGLCKVNDKYEYTIYSSSMSLLDSDEDKIGSYSFKQYNNPNVYSLDFKSILSDESNQIKTYDLKAIDNKNNYYFKHIEE